MIDTRVFGDPAACHSVASSLQSYGTALDTTVDVLTSSRNDSGGAWDGLASEAFAAEVANLRTEVITLQERAAAFGEQVTTFATSLSGVRTSFSGLRADAVAAGLAVTSEAVLPPTAPPADADDDGGYELQVTTYNNLVQRALDARSTESTAHDAVTSAAASLTAAPVIVTLLQKLGFLPGSTTPWGLGAFGLGGLLTGGGWAAAYLTTMRYGTFRPRFPAGTPGGLGGTYRGMSDFRSQPWYRRAWQGSQSTNYQARQGMTVPRGRWNAVGRFAGPAGAALTVATSAVSQWREDSDDPSMGTPERVTRAATQGASTGAGALAGGMVGAKIGAGLGSLAGPVGTVAGGIVGGLIGGFIGSGAGEWVGNQLVDVAGDAGEAIADAAGDAADFIGDAAGNAGDAIGDAWDSLWG